MSMGLNLIEAGKLSQDMLQKGVINTFVLNSPVLDRLPFMEISGNGYAYNLVNDLPEVSFRGVNEGYIESGVELERQVEQLVMLGGDVDADAFIVSVRGSINDVRAIQTELKCKSVSELFTKTFFYGDTATDRHAFDGLEKRLEKGIGTKISKTLAMPKTIEDAFLVEEALTDLCESVKGGKPDVIYVDAKTQRIFTRALHLLGYNTGTGIDEFGKPCVMFNSVPIIVVPDALKEGHVFAVKFGAEEFVSGLTCGGVKARDLGEAHDKPVFRTRVEFYCGLAVFQPKAFALLEISKTK